MELRIFPKEGVAVVMDGDDMYHAPRLRSEGFRLVPLGESVLRASYARMMLGRHLVVEVPNLVKAKARCMEYWDTYVLQNLTAPLQIEKALAHAGEAPIRAVLAHHRYAPDSGVSVLFFDALYRRADELGIPVEDEAGKDAVRAWYRGATGLPEAWSGTRVKEV